MRIDGTGPNPTIPRADKTGLKFVKKWLTISPHTFNNLPPIHGIFSGFTTSIMGEATKDAAARRRQPILTMRKAVLTSALPNPDRHKTRYFGWQRLQKMPENSNLKNLATPMSKMIPGPEYGWFKAPALLFV